MRLLKGIHPYKKNTTEISQFGSFVIIAAGVFGMLFCLPYLWSANIADLVGAGFPFVAGNIGSWRIDKPFNFIAKNRDREKKVIFLVENYRSFF
ncbi:hypothetical protein Fleli_1719 [Bernardetia litoralis DSM 6794]|uniref:Uncharacterized protein n=1 Tax=Bernardetia litoralis (strain ATCC 23117 / DSM 6794 / NBRC 15988 / NCIMB 1366 / Fx l1 / Sio-4) TaxID=880071 RepID=I4AJJ0_BERLS|nr:hypothetical protein [Bernardetia litoralis]AFM04125.1 hypothetical protein Fleli_1719 [Bernardetia litoralis DSM 6794]